MVFLRDNRSVGIEDIEKIHSTLVEDLAPALYRNSSQIPFIMASDVVEKGLFVQKVDSHLTRKLFVEYEVGRSSYILQIFWTQHHRNMDINYLG